ncbi:E3 ubiquitin-protein ligase ATL4-like [Elaeis guineensis]|uniref:E3 ubiquitin-protein ligase ATL4-like n=1 Tax=Elaeis guineensis var. tenera TaxID=51953 RepID=A0A6J0PP24_ELAGV|nr:E3 ubiquitin-protein ligase ATL4-like [Elaeis guineensis]
MASPPPPPPPLPQFPTPSGDSSHRGPSSSSTYKPSLFIIAAILALVIIASAALRLLRRFLSRSSSSTSSSAPPLIHHSRSASAASSVLSDKEKVALIDSLPLFSLASSVVVLPKSSPDCAVCLSPFQPHDELRLLPACRHAFHSSCIDTWLRSTSSCPLCRSSITIPAPPLPPLHPATDAADNPPRSSSFHIEIGSVSRRRTSAELDPAEAGTSLPNPPPPPPPPPPHLRSYSLGSSFEYVVDEEVEAVVARIRRAKEHKAEPAGPPPPGEAVAEAAGGGSRNWLKEYVDRLTSSASSSFSSLRFSGRWSHRYDDGGGGGGGGGGRDSWDLEGNYREEEEGELSGYYTFYRWLVGA